MWIFFQENIPVALARKLASFLLTETMNRRPELGLDSYDRIFPNQDTLPQGGLGNLIALPLQRKPRATGNSVFLNENFQPHQDQWAFLSSVIKAPWIEIEALAEKALIEGKITGVRRVHQEDDEKPWEVPPSGKQIKVTFERSSFPKHITLVLGNQVYIAKEGLPPFLINELIRIAAFQNPEFYKAQAMRLPVFQIPRIIGCAEDYSKHIGLPRGCLDDITRLLEELEIQYSINDERNSGVPIQVDFLGMLSEDQTKAFHKMRSHDIGILAAATAFGKTVVAINLIAERAVNTLILVHRRQLQEQWLAGLTSFLHVNPEEIGVIGSGKSKATGLIDVAMVQSLSRKGTVNDIVAEYGHLVVDECHHISARSFEIVARRCKAKYVTGLSATITRKDGHHPIIYMQCGPVRYSVEARYQIEKSPFDHRVILRETGFTLQQLPTDEGGPSIHHIYGELVANEKRNELIIQDVLKALNEKRSPILLTERKEHLNYFAERLARLIKNVIVLQGGMPAKKRKEALNKLGSISDQEERIIIATGRYLGEGFDDKRLDTLFLAFPISWRGTLAQYAGRLHRYHTNKKEVTIYDYVDSRVPVLARMRDRRLKGYRFIGYRVLDYNAE